MLVSRSASRIPLDSFEARRKPQSKSSRKEIACSYRAWKGNPNPSFFRANFALEGDRLWELDLTKRKFPSEEQYEQISLGDLIQSKSADWPYVVKLILAITLAHSLLYLNGGPWLNGSWTRSKIVFYKNGAFVSARPFLRTQISNVVKEYSDLDDHFHHYPGNLEFGVALLEIHLGKRIDEPSITTSRRWGIASEILDQQQYKMQDDYRNAVIACLQPDFGIKTGFTPSQFRKRIFDKIVSPLKKEFENGFKVIIKPNSLDEAATKIDLISGQFLNFSSVQKPLTHVPSKPPPRQNLVQKVETQRLTSAVYTTKTNVGAQGTVIERSDHLLITSNRLTPAKSTTFSLFEDENQPQNIPEEL
jgi:hypothetical protein